MINNAKVAGIVRAMLVVNALLNAERAPFSSLLAILRDNSGSNTIPIAIPTTPRGNWYNRSAPYSQLMAPVSWLETNWPTSKLICKTPLARALGIATLTNIRISSDNLGLLGFILKPAFSAALHKSANCKMPANGTE